ncbi:MAG: hypothetical protein CVT75_02135 [Alphaproteobacteria bacterium HGW-Alphaproteobacteria-14]|nr:MAG: hypothetical protein CVT75_02135 [Alphaproteobacteria bacterium HGW-Alphaproteobacteria-14]
MMMAASVALIAAPMALPTAAAAQEWPMVGGEYAEMTGIFVKDGGSLKYAQYLASEWVRNQEFAKSQGWITGYGMYGNVNPREGEPHIYLVVTFKSIPDAAEDERRSKAYDAWSKKTIAENEAAAGNRAEYRTVMGSMLLQEFKVR